MAQLSKRQKAIAAKVKPNFAYPAADAFNLLKEVSSVKFNEAVDVAVHLGVDPRRSDQMVRGATVLPNGTGKSVRVAVFAQGAGLMPNPKVGTVAVDVAGAVRNAKAGQVRYRTEKGGIIHCTIGKVDFTPEALIGNLNALLADLNKAKPAASKGVFMKRVSVSSTMGPGLLVDMSSLVA
ncbi:MAG: 50S ribosomal protein L1 [Halothiobacillus sp. 28-55-5]|nr:MAG: 50S ribosomal protein L1 [Halothiobacillus sp. 28-55-5]